MCVDGWIDRERDREECTQSVSQSVSWTSLLSFCGERERDGLCVYVCVFLRFSNFICVGLFRVVVVGLVVDFDFSSSS